MKNIDGRPNYAKRQRIDYTKYEHYDLSILTECEKRVILARIQRKEAKSRDIAKDLEMQVGSFSAILNRAKSKLDGTFDYEKQKKARREYIDGHYDAIKKRQQKYNDENKASIKKWKQNYMSEYYQDHKNEYKERNRKYYENNREQITKKQRERYREQKNEPKV